MKTLLCTVLLCILATMGYCQNGIIGSGFANGWNNPNDAISFDQGFGNSRITTLNPNGTGNQFFRFVKFWNFNNSEFGPSSCSDQDLTSDVNLQINDMPNACGGAFFINCPNTTDNYVFKSNDPDGDDVIYFKVEGDIREITNVSTPTAVYDGDPATITATTDDALALGQRIFLRYTTDGFASSTIVEMTAIASFAAPTDYTADIPGFPEGTTVTYYTFTSGTMPSPAEADWYTINGNTNGGANYTYTVLMTLPIELTYFEGTSIRNIIELTWATASEINFDYFEVQKLQAKEWHTLGTVASGVFDVDDALYQLIDEQPAIGTNLYRLKSIDLDGSYEYSEPISVQHVSESIKVYPTYFTDHITISGGIEGNSCYILDYSGRLVLHHELGRSKSRLPVANLDSGIYILQIVNMSGQVVHLEKLVKQ